jgi:hypothetical protein
MPQDAFCFAPRGDLVGRQAVAERRPVRREAPSRWLELIQLNGEVLQTIPSLKASQAGGSRPAQKLFPGRRQAPPGLLSGSLSRRAAPLDHRDPFTRNAFKRISFKRNSFDLTKSFTLPGLNPSTLPGIISSRVCLIISSRVCGPVLRGGLQGKGRGAVGTRAAIGRENTPGFS